MRVPRVRFTVRRMMVAVAGIALVLAIVGYLLRVVGGKPLPTNAVEALAYAARCAREREVGFRVEDYDAVVTRLRPSPAGDLFHVTFIRRDQQGKTTREISYTITDYGYCMKSPAGTPPSPAAPGPPEPE
jgi:hypothetical protein